MKSNKNFLIQLHSLENHAPSDQFREASIFFLVPEPKCSQSQKLVEFTKNDCKSTLSTSALPPKSFSITCTKYQKYEKSKKLETFKKLTT